jgi:hypothetical protein
MQSSSFYYVEMLTFLRALPELLFQRLANRKQKNGALAFRVWRKELGHVIIEGA